MTWPREGSLTMARGRKRTRPHLIQETSTAGGVEGRGLAPAAPLRRHPPPVELGAGGLFFGSGRPSPDQPDHHHSLGVQIRPRPAGD